VGYGLFPGLPPDLTDEQWALIEPMVAARGGGRPVIHPRCRIVDAILYVDRTGCSWRHCRKTSRRGTPSTWYFQGWAADGTTDRVHDELRTAVRDGDAGTRWPRPVSSDSQSVPGGSTVGKDSRGYDAGKKVDGRKRHLVVDTMGLLIVVLVTAASVQDRDGGITALTGRRWRCPRSAHL